MQRLSAPERTREELRALMNGELGTAAGRSDLVRLVLRLIVEEALESEVDEALGRDRYARGEGERAGYRNGYRTGKVKTAEGAVEYAAPQVRETPEPFVSGVRSALSGRTQAFEDLAVELDARGLSTRDIEDAFTDERGRRLLSRAAVSEITERLWAEYEAFSKRDLSERLPLCRRHRRTPPPGAETGGGARRMGHRRRWAQGSAGVDGRFEGGRRDRAGLLPGPARTGPGRSLARRLRRRAGNHPGDRGMLSALGAPAPGPPHAQPRHQGLGRSVAGVHGARRRLLPGAVASDRAQVGERHPRRLRRGRAERARLL